MNLTFSYDDVLLMPQYSDIVSRSEIDISVDLGKDITLEMPIISSPMDGYRFGSSNGAGYGRVRWNQRPASL